ncbi:competence/damage-inducible protein A [Faecalicatena contorta]|uniref:competence/damage-inducible protein A n=1 Tax=Faecalicatena contorta TaxID=39482 RepID=UPI001F1DDB52|nr:competence/damage-inducible protein A [Faecalicatena contorta]MCF2680186.1 competence/damage-inducible protein A [Faecalicatena contorta]
MTVEFLSVGTEILLGNIVNTNAAYLSERCAAFGLSCYHQSVVGDNEERLEGALCLALSRSDIVILSGGLGPTKDDLTKEVTAKVFGRELVEDAHTKERITEYFRRSQSRKITDNNWKQALVPEGAIVIDNDNGTAPGLILEQDFDGEMKRAILLPGPPNELKPMFEKDIAPYLNAQQPEGIYSCMVKLCGIGESRAESMITDLLKSQENPTLAPYAKTGEVHLRVTARAKDEKEAQQIMHPMLTELRNRFGNLIYTEEEDVTLEEMVVRLLAGKHMTVTTAESCTGGRLAGRIMNVSGASDVYSEGYITYSNEAKHKLLGVKKETLEKYSAVSPQTAEEMARGAALAAEADVALSVTGIAGPGGGTPEKPVGLVYIGCYVNGNVRVEECHFNGNRDKVRDSAVVKALTILREQIWDGVF